MRELIIDSFAGGGGASTGIEMALGVSPDIAINHDSVALNMHAANHPATKHIPHSIWKVDPTSVCAGRSVGLLWASPDCKHFSKAKGGKPVEKNIRDLAWVVVRWARQVAPRVIILENVEEFKTWGPLGDDDRPCPHRKGSTFKRWIGELERLGYKVEWQELRSSVYGVPTIRKRLYVIARNDGEPIVWPAYTHGSPHLPDVIAGKKLAWRTAAEDVIDWSIPCHSIFLTPEEARAVGVRRPLADATMARIAKGVKRYVLDAAKPFIVNLTHHGGERTEPIDDPTMTVTGAHRGEKALVVPFVSAAQQGGSVRPIDVPYHTVTASSKDQNQIAVPFVTGVGGRMGQTGPRGVDVPVQTLTAKADSVVVTPHLMTMRNGADEPTQTITSGGAHLHLVAAFLAQHNYLEPGHDARQPVSTIVAKGSTQGLAAVNLLRQFGTGVGSSPDEPVRTVMADGGGKTQLAASFLTKYYGTDQDPQLDEPLHTATSKDRFGLVTVMIDGEPYVITDIGLRMLTPRELFRAQGFPDSYIIDRGENGSPITKTDQVRMCGNSVCPRMAKVLVAANFAPRERSDPGIPEFYLHAAE